MEKHIRFLAARQLLKDNTKDFPIPVEAMLLKDTVIQYKAYGKNKDYLEALGLSEYAQYHRGFVCRPSASDYYIFVDEKLSKEEQETIKAHELAHIALNHVMIDITVGYAAIPPTNSNQELEADYFGIFYRSAPSVLYAAGVQTLGEIVALTGLSREDSKKVLYEINTLSNDNLSFVEKELCNRFADFIKDYRRSRQSAATRILKFGKELIIAALIAILLGTSGLLFNEYKAKKEIQMETAKSESILHSNFSKNVRTSNDKYHKLDCVYVKDSFGHATIGEAFLNGLGACRACRPLD